jgi:hypothetical protein
MGQCRFQAFYRQVRGTPLRTGLQAIQLSPCHTGLAETTYPTTLSDVLRFLHMLLSLMLFGIRLVQ